MITVVTLVTWDSISNAALLAVRSAKQLYIQSMLHPCAQGILSTGLRFSSMDDLYETSVDFEDLYRQIALRLVEAQDCVYVMTGSFSRALLAAIDSAAADASVPVNVIPGVSLSGAAFPAERIDRRLMAHDLPKRIIARQSLAVEEIDSALIAGEVKLMLSEFFPDEWPVTFAYIRRNGCFEKKIIPLCELDRQNDYDAATLVYVPAVPFDKLTRYGYADLLDVMQRLRAKNGCPWDREQTHESLKQPLIEECYELLDAIDEGDDAHMVEELGDVLMQTVFHETIAAEQGRFTSRDVTTGIVSKLIYRHPHIFGTAHVDSSDEVLKNWETLKMAEKGQKTETDALMSVTRSLPSLMFAKKVQKKAAHVGFDWANADEAFYKIAEETDELRRAMNGEGSVEEELGDLLFAVVNVARLLHLEPELALRAAADKFIKRFSRMETLVQKDGGKLNGMTLSEMDRYWDKAKAEEQNR